MAQQQEKHREIEDITVTYQVNCEASFHLAAASISPYTLNLWIVV